MDINAKKMLLMQCNDEQAIDAAIDAMNGVLKVSSDTTLSEFDKAKKTITISDTVSLVKNSPRAKTFHARIKIPDIRNYFKLATHKDTVSEATREALIMERDLLVRKENGLLATDSDLSWTVICARTIRELTEQADKLKEVAKAKGKKNPKPQQQTHASIIRDKLKDNVYLKRKKITNIEYADLADAFRCDEFQDLSHTVRNNTIKAIRLVFEFALKNRELKNEQIPQIPELNWVEGESRPVFTNADLEVFMSNFQNFYESNSSMNHITEAARRVFPFYITVCSSCGLRPGQEVVNIKWSHLQKGITQVIEKNEKGEDVVKDVTVYFADIIGGKMSTRTKGGGVKLVPYSREIVIYAEAARAIEGLYEIQFGEKKTLSEIVEEAKNQPMFSGSEKRDIDFADVFSQYRTYLGKKLSQSYTSYSLRHEFINAELNRGVKKSDIAEQCGTSESTIDKYYKKYRALNRVERLLSKEDIQYFIDIASQS